MAKAIPCVIGILALLSHPGLTISSLYPAPISELTDAVSRRHSEHHPTRHSEPGEESRFAHSHVLAGRDPLHSLRMTGLGFLDDGREAGEHLGFDRWTNYPSTDATQTPDMPAPQLCLAAPRTFDEMISLAATPVNGTPEPTPTPGPIPKGTAADPATIEGVTATVRELVACFNAGELLRVYGLYSDRYLHHLLSRQDLTTRSAYDSFATPLPSAPDERAQILDIRGVRVLPDGRMGALVTIKYAVVPVPKTFFFVFVEQDGHWIIDDIRGEISFGLP